MILTIAVEATGMVIPTEIHVCHSCKIAICQSQTKIILLPGVMETSWTDNVINVMPMDISHLNVHKQMSTAMCKLYNLVLALLKRMTQAILSLTLHGSF